MGQGKDKNKRRRRTKTDAEKQETLRRKNAEQRQKDQRKYGTVAGFFGNSGGATAGGGSDVNESEERGEELGIGDVADDNTPNHDAPVLNDDVEDEADDVVIFAEDVDPGFDDDPMIIANLDIDEDDWDGSLDEAADAEPEVVQPTKMKRGVQLDYMRAINHRLKVEVQDKTKALEKKWLIEHLANNDGWVRKEQARSIIKSLIDRQARTKMLM